MKDRVVNVYPYFRNQGGAQNVVLQLAEKLNSSFPIVLISTPAKDVPDAYRNRAEYRHLSLSNVRRLADGNTVFTPPQDNAHSASVPNIDVQKIAACTCGTQYVF